MPSCWRKFARPAGAAEAADACMAAAIAMLLETAHKLFEKKSFSDNVKPASNPGSDPSSMA
jgi:hypothetical protein